MSIAYSDVLKLLTFFLIYSFIGWILESIYKTAWQKKPVNSGFLIGPVCPIYGFGALIMLIFLEKFKSNNAIVFLIAFVVLSIWEYIAGIYLELVYKTKYWDYSNYKFNIGGRVCLLNSVFWGILGVIFVNIIHPFIQTKVNLVNSDIIPYINIVAYTLLILDIIISSIKVGSINKQLNKLKEIRENIKEKLDDIEAKIDKVSKDARQKVIDELRARQDLINLKLYKQTKRLKKAFPTMRSDRIKDFFDQKIDIAEIKERLKIIKDKK